MISFLLTILTALILAYALGEIAKYFSLPRVTGQIIAGLVLGAPFIKRLIFDNETTIIFSSLANIGVILLFFFIGLEIDLSSMKRNFKKSFYISFFNTVIPLLSGFLASYYLFQLNFAVSLIIGVSLAVSAEAISLDILDELRMIKSRIGSIIISSGAVDDIFELFLLSIILISFNVSIVHATLLQISIEILLFIALILLFRFVVIPIILKTFVEEKTHTAIFTGSLIIVLLIAYLSEVLGMSSLIGALFAGIFVKQILFSGGKTEIHEEQTISKHIKVISFGFLIPLFFVWIGANTDLSSISAESSFVFVLIAITFLGSSAGTIIGVLLSRGSFKEGLITAFGVLPKGDTELIIASLALQSGIISTPIFSAIVITALTTTLIAPVIFKMLVKRA